MAEIKKSSEEVIPESTVKSASEYVKLLLAKFNSIVILKIPDNQ